MFDDWFKGTVTDNFFDYAKARSIRNWMLDSLKMSNDEQRRLSKLLLNRTDFAVIEPVKPDILATMVKLCGPNGRFLLKVLLARNYEDTPDQSTEDADGNDI